MRTLKYIVTGQKIERDLKCDFEDIKKGTNNYINLLFVFDSEWKDTIKVISMKSSDGIETNRVLENNQVSLPLQVTDGSLFYFELYGKKTDGTIIRTNTEYVWQV
nr:MAG TPA: hypothetical protein [Caudoviricetes sp.]